LVRRCLFRRLSAYHVAIVRSFIVPTAFAFGSLLLLSGCFGNNSRAVADENDRLRRELLDAQKQLAAAQARTGELEADLKALAAQSQTLPEDVLAATPRVQTLEIDRLSHARDTDGDARPDHLVVYLRTLDGYQRVLQIAGDITIIVACLPRDQDAVTVARKAFKPAEVRDCYRSGITGTHYTFEVPIDPSTATAHAACTIRAVFVDPSTGVEHSAQREITLP
jgi:hypothetical protein